LRVLLFSGGLDSTAVAAWQRPDHLLTIDYGQRAAGGEIRAASQVSRLLRMQWSPIRLDCSAIGSGLLAGEAPSPHAKSPEWWPYRNQLLITAAAAWGLARGATEILLGTVAADVIHSDGSPDFIAAMDRLLRLQEGGVRLTAPALGYPTSQLLATSGLDRGVIGWTHSCDRGAIACGSCPSCDRRSRALDEWETIG
jgi:7-cyano-7-deazaguanine synthase